MLLNGMIMLAGTIICFTASETLMGMFTENPETVRLGTAALQIISIGFIPSAISVTASGALEVLSKGSVPGDFVIKIYYSDHSGSLSAVPFCRGRCCVECVLDL